MSKVEELRDYIVLKVAASYHGTIATWDEAIKRAITEVDALIADSELQGMKKQKAQDAAYDKYEQEAYSEAEKAAFARGKREGTEQERERIRRWIEHDADMCDGGYGLLYTSVLDYLSSPASPLAPAKEEKP